MVPRYGMGPKIALHISMFPERDEQITLSDHHHRHHHTTISHTKTSFRVSDQSTYEGYEREQLYSPLRVHFL